MRFGRQKTPWINRAFLILNLLIMLLYGGYTLLSMAGLAERLLPEPAARRAVLWETPRLLFGFGAADGG